MFLLLVQQQQQHQQRLPDQNELNGCCSFATCSQQDGDDSVRQLCRMRGCAYVPVSVCVCVRSLFKLIVHFVVVVVVAMIMPGRLLTPTVRELLSQLFTALEFEFLN